MITKSTIIYDLRQPDGRREITERHERDDGPAIEVTFIAEATLDADVMMAARAIQLDEELASSAVEKAENETLAVAQEKGLVYAADQTDLQLKLAGMTDAEVAALKAAHG